MPAPVDLSKLSDAGKNNVDKLVTNVNNIDTSGFIYETKYNTDKSELEKKIRDTCELVTKKDNSAKITELES